jgi:D-erythrose 4-phosphate dehydrogenase
MAAFPGQVDFGDGQLLIDGRPISVSHARSPEEVDWRALEIDLVVESSGSYGRRPELTRFSKPAARACCFRTPASAPAMSMPPSSTASTSTALTGSERLVSAASCTTNAIVPVLDLLDREVGIEQALLTTLHSVMNDQPLIDGYHHDDLRRTRSAMQSIIPVSTGLARGVERLLPQLTGRVQAKAIRVPTLNVSAIDLTISTQRPVSAGEINALLAEAAARPAGQD